jgi:hypothetical protein
MWLVAFRPCEVGKPFEVPDVLGGERDRRARLAEEAFGWALIDERAAVDDDQPVAHMLELAEDVGGDEHRPLAVADGTDELAHIGDPGRVETVRGLVQDKQRGVAEESGGDAEALLHSERVLAEPVRTTRAQPDEVENLRYAAYVVSAKGGQNPEVLDAGEARPQRRGFDQRAHTAQVAGGLRHAGAEHGPVTPRGAHEPEQHRHGGRLAGAVRADEACDDTGRNLDAQPVDRELTAVALGQTVGDHRGWAGFRCSHKSFIAN